MRRRVGQGTLMVTVPSWLVIASMFRCTRHREWEHVMSRHAGLSVHEQCKYQTVVMVFRPGAPGAWLGMSLDPAAARRAPEKPRLEWELHTLQAALSHAPRSRSGLWPPGLARRNQGTCGKCA